MSKKLPELLAPAGSPDALDAAITAGADAVYFGGAAFNARMNAKNFAGELLADAFGKCRAAGVKTNVTLNTLVHSREMDELLRAAAELYELGADALIVADLGAASLIHKHLPDLELHASTQAAGHNLDAARELSRLGFSRMVAARELSADDLAYLCENSPIETELFIHGAICVSQSGQCLASSLIGGRSGNRGQCAQPCRLPYRSDKGRESYALSLKDMCLAEHVPELIKLGAASLKIEGRMKSADYVYGVTSIYRRLLDENRAANADELEQLRALFSRSGFTDGYFVGKLGRKMLGVRTESDKQSAKALPMTAASYAKLAQKRAQARADELAEAAKPELELQLEIHAGLPCRLTAKCGESAVSVEGAIPDTAVNRPLTEQSVTERISKLGGTNYLPGKVEVKLDEGLLLPMSALNALRRDAVERMDSLRAESLLSGTAKIDSGENAASASARRAPAFPGFKPEKPSCPALRTARFTLAESIPEDITGFDIVYLPLEQLVELTEKARKAVNGVILPPVIFDSERDRIKAMLESARAFGISHVLVSNIGHLALARELGFTAHGDFRLNIYNTETARVLLGMGFEDLLASPELTGTQLADLGLAAVIYGKLPLMVLEKCAIRDLYGCDACKSRRFLPLIDRKGAAFPMIRTLEHRNIVYNSVPFYMADRSLELARLARSADGGLSGHFIFSDESASEAESVIKAYESGSAAVGQIRRFPK